MVKWRAFFMCNGVIKPALHFFPHSTSTSAPYPVACTVTIFGQNISSKSVTLEGARINQPDGVRLDALFPELIEGSNGLIGLEVTIGAESNRVDLSASQCVVELIQGNHATKFFAQIVDDENDKLADRLIVPPQEHLHATLVAINGSDQAVQVTIDSSTAAVQPVVEGENICQKKSLTLAPLSVLEIGEQLSAAPTLSDSVLSTLANVGQDRFLEGSFLPRGSSRAVAFYALFRDPQTNSPISVQAL